MPVAASTPSPALAGSDVAAPPVGGQELPQVPSQSPTPLAADGTAGAAKAGDPELRRAVKDANAALAANGTQLVFVFDDQSHHFAVKLLDIQTQKVVQELPPAAMRATASALTGPPTSGALVDTKA
jgi:uncharacterized FlaG/YvyC family protein